MKLDIGAAVGFKDKTGDSLTAENAPIVLIDPVIGKVEAKTKADVDKLGMSLLKLSEEDPPLQLRLMKHLAKQLSREWVNFI